MLEIVRFVEKRIHSLMAGGHFWDYVIKHNLVLDLRRMSDVMYHYRNVPGLNVPFLDRIYHI